MVPGTTLWEPIHLANIAMVWLLPVTSRYHSAGCNILQFNTSFLRGLKLRFSRRLDQKEALVTPETRSVQEIRSINVGFMHVDLLLFNPFVFNII